MKLNIKKTKTLLGSVTPPSSKSQSIRAMMIALLAEGESIISNVLDSDDTQTSMNVLRQLGANIRFVNNQLIIKDGGLPLKEITNHVYSGNSGITTRFILPILGLRANVERLITLDCGEQMRARPIQSLVNALNHLGMTIAYRDAIGKLPLTVTGRLEGGKATIDGITSQYLSALLIALPCAENLSVIEVVNLHERPYVEMTLNCLREQNIQLKHTTDGPLDTFYIQGKQRYKNIETIIANDFSSASYIIAAAALTQSKVCIEGLSMADPQGDKKLITILKDMGADIDVQPTRLFVRGGKALTGIKVDANDFPDLLPTLAVIGTFAEGKTEITNVKQARIKETDRIHSMVEGLKNMGARIDEYADGITVYQSTLQGHAVQGFDDHRTVMALSIAGMIADGITTINKAEAINKTFPNFIELMQSLGAKLEVDNETTA